MNPIFFKILSCVLYSLNNVFLKALPLTPLVIIALQHTVATFFLWRPGLFVPLSDMRCWMSSTFAFLGMIFWIFSLKNLSVFQTVTLGFLSPIFTIVGARVFLKESITLFKCFAILSSIMGGLFISLESRILTLTFQKDDIHFFLPLAGSVCFAICQLINKKTLHKLSYQSVTFFMAISLSFLSWVTLLIEWLFGHSHPSLSFPTTPTVWGNAVLLGLSTAGAFLFSNKALSVKEITFLLPFGSTRFIATALLGCLLFLEKAPSLLFGSFFFLEKTPSLWMWGGSIIIIVSLALLTRHEKKFPTSLNRSEQS